ncbi:genetic competence negative regulator [Sutcliffiella horikoshii]|uniref:genetic competence negative regulator n=1 Tax=Sutcliffiella horikoshii TaxID=79883 RepID=UPI001F3FAF12|nr:genetic competence negative regulator [Sutcliffiella horikoshii]MCG1023011.1 genetic competence negative regulator [Sutcliffiella horikoshii]
MRLERLNYNKIKIFLTFDDLEDRGLTKEDLWKDSQKVHQLFRDMIDEASAELGFEVSGSLNVEVYALQAQGMVVIVTSTEQEELEEEFNDDYIEMQVTVDESQELFYVFESFDHLIDLAKRLQAFHIHGGTIYSHDQMFYLLLSEEDVDIMMDIDTLIALLSEYGTPSTMTTHRVEEYGKKLLDRHAMKQLNKYFN